MLLHYEAEMKLDAQENDSENDPADPARSHFVLRFNNNPRNESTTGCPAFVITASNSCASFRDTASISE